MLLSYLRAGLGLSVVATSLVLGPSPAMARGPIERACLAADRRAASQELCTCIQAVADQVLSNAEQRKGAKFFKDPHKSQDMRQSDNASDEAFWLKWKSYGATAQKYCG